MSVAGETQIEKKIPIKEKLRLYLINLAKDYQEATLDLVKDAKANKRRSFITAVDCNFAREGRGSVLPACSQPYCTYRQKQAIQSGFCCMLLSHQP
ncbi:uncharacterized protein LOC126455568 isoform X3 [Schistocerca serialis cubense]|uniref:uncharacterized protein LOC126455568 isoform X3 n=1 Tax=Schistocerca serialis cubense TaxID=2023355 RepID=UPI00214F4CF2|nr:uncharacterized protein LOC126455568 isoform X3 [Schistocerca serialis cubense]